MVFDVTRKIEVGTGIFCQFDEAGPTAAEEGDAANGHVRVAGIGQGVAVEEGLYLLEDGHSRFRRRPIADTAHGKGMTGIFQRIDVVGRFFIGMSRNHSLQHPFEAPFRNDGLDPFFSDGFNVSDGADKGIRPFMGLKPPFSLRRKGTVAVVPDIAGAAVGQGLAKGVTVAFRDVDGDFIEFVFGNGNQAFDVRKAQ